LDLISLSFVRHDSDEANVLQAGFFDPSEERKKRHKKGPYALFEHWAIFDKRQERSRKQNYFFCISAPQHFTAPSPPFVTMICAPQLPHRYIFPSWLAITLPSYQK
jgi:hypothetical protein